MNSHVYQIFFHNVNHSVVEWSIRLQGGRTPLDGRIEIFIAEEWGVVVDDQWDLQDAQVVCRQLGFPLAKVNIVKLLW